MSRSINFLAMLVLLITAAALAVADMCTDVATAAAPCLDFVKGNGGDSPSADCCAGAKDLDKRAKSKDDVKAICECLKGVLSKIRPYEPTRVPLISKKCNVKLSLPPITNRTDCSK